MGWGGGGGAAERKTTVERKNGIVEVKAKQAEAVKCLLLEDVKQKFRRTTMRR